MYSFDYFFNNTGKNKPIKELIINDNFIKQSLEDKTFHIHTEIDLWINIAIMELLNYEKLLGEKSIFFIKENKKYNCTDIEENINTEKLDKLEILSEVSETSEKTKKRKIQFLVMKTQIVKFFS